MLLVTLMGQPRILMAMARDGLLPANWFADIHPRFQTPYKGSVITGIFVALVCGFIPLSVLVELVRLFLFSRAFSELAIVIAGMAFLFRHLIFGLFTL